MSLDAIPAEIVADQAVKLLKGNKLFEVARELEMTAYLRELPTFGDLSISAKSMVGALLDFVRVDRVSFANAWQPSAKPNVTAAAEVIEVVDDRKQASLFADKD